MPIINVPSTFSPLQIEVVAVKGKKDVSKLKRSCEGSLHLRPGVVTLTKDEMEYIKVVRPEVHSQFQFLALTEEERKEIQAAPSEKAPEKVTDQPAEEKPETTHVRNKRDKG
jgi:hypothetical protein